MVDLNQLCVVDIGPTQCGFYGLDVGFEKRDRKAAAISQSGDRSLAPGCILQLDTFWTIVGRLLNLPLLFLRLPGFGLWPGPGAPCCFLFLRFLCHSRTLD